MNEKTWQVDVSFEGMRMSDRFTAEETPRLAALVGAGYLHEVTPVYEPAEEDADEGGELLERFEDQDEVETLPQPRRGRRAKE